ncbi:MAG: sigma 54-interacting transcriptional regulator [Acidobacteria bacterium]|nr:sigma 54-interacting transcriptional regulator [Acidobacteriota bacterium]
MMTTLPARDPEPVPGLLDEATAGLLATTDLGMVLRRIEDLLRRHFGETRVRILRSLPERPGIAEVLEPATAGAQARGTFEPLTGTAAEALRTLAPAVDPGGCCAFFPLVVEGRALGVLRLAHPASRVGRLGCLEHAEKVSRLVAVALRNSLMVEEIRRLNALLCRENQDLRQRVTAGRRYVAESPSMRAVMEQVRRVAPSDATVLVRGETGTGKEGIARAIHELSPRLGGPFVVVNLGALPPGLVESELFGHEQGAFTGADARRTGKFELASGGTLLLDEIGDAPPEVQVRLLRALQEREVTRVGGTRAVPVDVRVIAATHRPLEDMVRAGTFRADLYYRLAAFPIVLPPLRDRPEDIRPLARHFVALHAARLNRKAPAIGEEALRRLERRAWPGNVRELENVLERALILGGGDQLELPDLPAPPVAEAPHATWEEIARRALAEALRASGGKIYGPGGAAARLGLRPTTLQGKLRRYGLR